MHVRRHFTPEQAVKTLPLVKRIVRDILETGGRLRELAPDGRLSARDQPAFDALLRRMTDLTAEMETIGCTYKDWSFSMGLVDFPAIMDGREVLLCWRSDEPEIQYYHGTEEGYAGRKPIPAGVL